MKLQTIHRTNEGIRRRWKETILMVHWHIEYAKE